jgi:hypothetical protein
VGNTKRAASVPRRRRNATPHRQSVRADSRSAVANGALAALIQCAQRGDALRRPSAGLQHVREIIGEAVAHCLTS